MTPIAFVMQFVWKRPIQEDIIEATEHINALMCDLEIAVTTLGFDINNPDECGDKWSAYRAAEAYLEVINRNQKKEKLIRVHLPGEAFWAAEIGKTEDGRIRAVLRNNPLTEHLKWGDEVALGPDSYEIVEPAEAVAKIAKERSARASKLHKMHHYKNLSRNGKM